MKDWLKSLRTRLFLWYSGSLLLLAVFFYIVVHILQLSYGTDLFIVLLVILAIIGFIIIYKITGSLTYLSSRMKSISSKNLNERILDIKNENEIGELAYSFNNLLNRLSDAFKREQQFIADVAHELKTPLSTLKSTLEISLNKDRTKDEYRRAIGEAILETNYISSTLTNVLDLAWNESSHELKKAKLVNLTILMDELFDITQKMAMSKKITVKKSFSENITILGYKERLARAILNIIDNAVKYTKSNGAIFINLEKTAEKAIVTIKDNGQGIDNKDLLYIFDRFFRGHKTDKVAGTGIGLAISKSIVNLHHGEIHVRSNLKEGSTFIISFPLT